MPLAPGAGSWPPFPEIHIGEDFYPQVEAFTLRIAELSLMFDDFQEPLTEAVHTVLAPAIRHNFDVEGPGWEQLAVSTVEKRGENHPILNETGQLKEAASSPEIWEIGVKEAKVNEVPVPYAAFHQGGTIYMPARPFIDFNDSVMGEIELVFGEWLDRKISEVLAAS